MKKIIISPWSKPLRVDDPTRVNPKNYPWWPELVQLLIEQNIECTQVGRAGELAIPGCKTQFGLPLTDLQKLLFSYDSWISVDNFFQHFAHYYGKRGVVLFGKSDPILFGYPENINLLKDRKYLRKDQFGIWESELYDSNVFVHPLDVLRALDRLPQRSL